MKFLGVLWVLRLRGTVQKLALTLLPMLPSTFPIVSASPLRLFEAQLPSPPIPLFTLRRSPHDDQRKTRGRVDRYSFLVRPLHSLLHAGLSRRTRICSAALQGSRSKSWIARRCSGADPSASRKPYRNTLRSRGLPQNDNRGGEMDCYLRLCSDDLIHSPWMLWHRHSWLCWMGYEKTKAQTGVPVPHISAQNKLWKQPSSSVWPPHPASRLLAAMQPQHPRCLLVRPSAIRLQLFSLPLRRERYLSLLLFPLSPQGL